MCRVAAAVARCFCLGAWAPASRDPGGRAARAWRWAASWTANAPGAWRWTANEPGAACATPRAEDKRRAGWRRGTQMVIAARRVAAAARSPRDARRGQQAPQRRRLSHRPPLTATLSTASLSIGRGARPWRARCLHDTAARAVSRCAAGPQRASSAPGICAPRA